MPIPSWLERAHDHGHISRVLSTLAHREGTRAKARAASQHQFHPSRRHKAYHFASLISTKPEYNAHYAITVGSDPSNTDCNRYTDIHPYDRTRVVVCPGEPSHDCPSSCTSGRYLNANWVRELAGGKWWIATQAPLHDTVHAFLSVILEGISPPPGTQLSNVRNLNRVRTVVQLTREFEGNMRKAHAYFPPLEGQSWVIDRQPDSTEHQILITLSRSHTIDAAHCIQSVISLQFLSHSSTPIGEPVVFQHFLYTSWPDHGVPAPEDREGLLRFAWLVDEANRDLSLYTGIADLDPNPPIMVHCSAGVGRTGAFIALCSLLRHYHLLPPLVTDHTSIHAFPPSPLRPLPEELQDDMVAQEIDSLREQRQSMVQRDDQVMMIYETLIAALKSLENNDHVATV